MQAFEATLKADPQMTSAYVEYAKLMIRAETPPRAASDAKVLRLVNKSIELSPEHGKARYLLGYLLLEQGKYGEALSSLQEAARLTPGDSETHYLLWRCYQKLGKAQQADHELRVYQELSVKPHEGKSE